MYSAFPRAYHEEEKKSSGKIFRPWDITKGHLQQDATVTTTTDLTSPPPSPAKHEHKMEAAEKPSSPTISNMSMAAGIPSLEALYDYAAMSSSTLPYLPHQPQDYLNLSGLPGDLLLSQNYALEEYARILTQDHQAKLLNSRKQRPKKYKCPHCDVGFSNNGQLKGHIRIHTGERPFKCDDPSCGKTFTRNEELTRHKRIHSGLRPFSCAQCGKRFGRKDHLKKHSRTHMQPRNGVYAVPVMFPLDTWAAASYPYMASVPILY